MSLHVRSTWYSRGTVRICLLAATILLAIARLVHRCGILQPSWVGLILGLSSRLTATALRAWRSRRTSELRLAADLEGLINDRDRRDH